MILSYCTHIELFISFIKLFLISFDFHFSSKLSLWLTQPKALDGFLELHRVRFYPPFFFLSLSPMEVRVAAQSAGTTSGDDICVFLLVMTACVADSHLVHAIPSAASPGITKTVLPTASSASRAVLPAVSTTDLDSKTASQVALSRLRHCFVYSVIRLRCCLIHWSNWNRIFFSFLYPLNHRNSDTVSKTDSPVLRYCFEDRFTGAQILFRRLADTGL